VLTDAGILIFNGESPDGKIASEPYIANSYDPNPAWQPLGDAFGGNNTFVTAAVEEPPAADGSLPLDLFGYAKTGAPAGTAAIHAIRGPTVHVDAFNHIIPILPASPWVDLNPQGYASSQIFAASSTGRVVGAAAPGPDKPFDAYVFNSPDLSGIGPMDLGPDYSSAANRINNHGDIIGNQLFLSGSGPTTSSSRKSFVVPHSQAPIPLQLRGFADSSATWARDIDDQGNVVGAATDSKGNPQALIWYPPYTAPPTVLTPPGASGAMAVHLNAAGDATVVSPPGFGGNIYVTNIYDPNHTFTRIPNIVAGSDSVTFLGPVALNNASGAFAGLSTVNGTSLPTVVRQLGPVLTAEEAAPLTNDLAPCLDQMQGILKGNPAAPPLDWSATLDLKNAVLDLTPKSGESTIQATDSGAAIQSLRSLVSELEKGTIFSAPALSGSRQQWIDHMRAVLGVLVSQ
jgi:hypothetical protein